jgi:predicted dehydrogenase/threonine dehydrogenase-like Zn-dependent dehydrogenase
LTAMKQIVQSLENGSVALSDIPCPALPATSVLIRNTASVISSGTERMLMEFGKASWIGKARQQPERVRMVIDKVKTDGFVSTLDSVRSKLSQPLPLGYSSAGVVLAVGSAVSEFRAGDRVCSNGAHAEIVAVPKNLCARIPDEVGDEAAAFAVLASIALEGIRLASPSLGETVAVCGLGLIGLLAVQILRANGCRVLGLDFVKHRLELAEQFGASTVDLSSGEDPVRAAGRFSREQGIDAVLITAATKSNQPVQQAAAMSRKRGRIVLVGVAGLELSRDAFYKKELSFQVSCSYGPGRYDPVYEASGQDYPLPYVRWTAQRNFSAVLDLLAANHLNVAPLISHRFSFEGANDAYQLIEKGAPHLGIVLRYSEQSELTNASLRRRTISLDLPKQDGRAAARVALIGAGAYASKVLMPSFSQAGASLDLILSMGGLSAAHWGRKHRFRRAGTDVEAALADPEIDTVAIATPHDSHASLVKKALAAGKNVFVEKPLALSISDLQEIEDQYEAMVGRGVQPRLMIGFNRRFAPHIVRMKTLLDAVQQPKTMVYTVNAGSLAEGHWTQDLSIGGGRIVGEACHFIDLLRFLAGAPIRSIQGLRTEDSNGRPSETLTLSMVFQDGSAGTVHYITSGHKAFPKERLEVFCMGRVMQLDNFRTLHAWGWPGLNRMKLWRQDKGAVAMGAAFINCVLQGEPSPIAAAEIFEVSRHAIEVAKG